MTIGRRGAIGLGAFGIGSVALGGCASTLAEGGRSKGVGAPPTSRTEEVDELLMDHDRVIDRLHEIDSAHTRGSDDLEAESATCARILEAMCLMGTYRDVPHAAWTEPRHAQRMAETLPKVHASLAAARQHLAEISDAHGARVDEKLRHEPDFPMRAFERVDEQARRMRVPTEQRLHMRIAIAQLSSRLRYEGTKEVTSGLVAKYDRALASRASVLDAQAKSDPPPEPATASPPTAPAPKPAPAPGSLASATEADSRSGLPRGMVGESCRSDDDCEPPLLCSASTCKLAEPSRSRSESVEAATKKVSKVGLYLLIPPLCGIGIGVLLTCLFMLIVAGALPAKDG